MAPFLKSYFRYFLMTLIPISLGYAQQSIKLENATELIEIAPQTYYLEDPGLDLTISDLNQPESPHQFAPYQQQTLNFSSTASAYWIKFKFEQSSAEDFYLNVGSAYIDAISLYEVDASQTLLSTRHTGDDLPFDSREIAVGNYLFLLDMDPGQTRTYYLRVRSEQPLFFQLRVGTLPNFVAYEHDLDFLQGIYFGFMLLIFLYNLFLYISTRESIYLYYIAYVFSITWFMASVFGYFFEYFWPESPIINGLVVVSSGLTMITATLFTQKFLNTKNSGPRWHLGSMIFLGAGVLVCLLVLFGLRIEGLKVAQGGLLLMAIYFIIMGIHFRLKGYRPAKYYLLAWGALVIGIFFAILESLNLTFVMSYLNAMQIGSALEVVLLSFALGDRINMYKEQKEDAQLKALQAAQENERLIQQQNVVLEQKVKERTAEVAQQNLELVELNKEKDMLIDTVDHDLRTPLHQIKGIMWLLEVPSLKISAENKNYLGEIENSVDRLSEMIGQMLNTHALEVNKLNLKLKTVDLGEVAAYVGHNFHPIASEKNIEIITDAPKETHFVEVDRNYMIQVLENLVSNAVKFSNKGSKVKLRVHSDQGTTEVAIQDEGPGISKADQKKLFGRFQRLSAKPTAGESSIGLGLSIVKKFVDAMKGKIRCESQLGEGTEFIISFPSQSAPVTHQAQA